MNGAWAQGNRANNEFIVVEFPRAVNPEQIDIYGTYNAGAVVKVDVRNGGKTSTPKSLFRFLFRIIRSTERGMENNLASQ